MRYSIYMKPIFRVEQKITAFVNRYKILNPDKTELLAFAQQKRLAFREKVTFYEDEKRTRESFTLRAEKVMDVHGQYFVEDMSGNLIGGFRKEFKKSLLRSSWVVFDADKHDLARVQESNVVLAVFRRVMQYIPIVGDIVDFIGWLLKYHFEFVALDDEKKLAAYKKLTIVRDHYEFSADAEFIAAVDRRVLIAMAVALDALQAR